MIAAEDGPAPGADRICENSAYRAARAEWHRNRAAIATDSSIRLLHEKFAALYSARTETDQTV
jgi:hypothetical protein